MNSTPLRSTFLPLGSLLQGWLADQIGLRATMAGAAIVMATVLVAIRLVCRRRRGRSP
jgi:hypothetical protein